MKLLVGLGNPGQKYANNRHNLGFMVADEIIRHQRLPGPRVRFQSQAWEGSIGGVKVVLLKPTTFMNESGRAVSEAMRFFKIEPEDVIVFHDELDLVAAKFKVKTGGGVAGHNGLRSLAAHMGPEFVRVRLGIGHPGHKHLVHSYVLKDFAKSDYEWIEPLAAALAEHVEDLVRGDAAGYSNKVHLTLNPREVREDQRKPQDGKGEDDA
jgi:PTH1 family peptidyl-tRNA hydrolase